MSQTEMDRVRDDLATMKQAVGVELPFGWEDVRASFALTVAGLMAMGWSLWPHELPDQWGMIPLLLFAVGYTWRLRVKYRRGTGRSSVRRREYTFGLVGAMVAGGFALVYRRWATELGIPLPFASGACLFLLGGAGVLAVLKDSRRAYWLGWAIPFMLCGLAIPSWWASRFVLLGAAVAVGSLVAGTVQGYQLKKSNAAHACD